LRVFENIVLRRIFGPKKEEVGGGWRKRHNGGADGKRQLRRPRRRWEYLIVQLRNIELEGVEWIHLAQDRDQWRFSVP